MRAAVDGMRGAGAWHSVPGPRSPGRLTPWQVPDSIELPCRREPDLYFAEDPNDLRQAKALCRTCPIRAACLAGALERGEPWGVWGGEMLEQGRIIADKRPRGRPRKNVIAA